MARRLCLIGVVRIEDDGRERTLRGCQPRLVLVRTALVAGHPVPAEELALVLWPSLAVPHWEGAVRGVVTKVRSFLGTAGALDNIGHGYRFRPGHLTIDVEDAALAIDDAEAARAAARWADAATAADAAADLLADPLLPGVDAAWLTPWRTRLERRRNRAYRLAAVSHSALGHHDVARDRAEAAIEADPFDEEAHRTLMGVLLTGGNRAEAMRAYARLRRLLSEELGVDPDAASRSLYDRAMRTGDEGAGLRVAGARGPLPVPRGWAL